MEERYSINDENILTGEVLDCKNGIVTVKLSSPCSSCSSSCAMAGGSKSKVIKIKSNNSFAAGQIVKLQENTAYSLKYSALAYLLPLVIMLLISGIADVIFKKDIVTAVSALISLILSWGILKIFAAPRINNSPYRLLD